MAKKILAILLMTVMILSVAACGSKSETDSPSEDTKTTEKAEKTEKKKDESSGKYKNISADTKPVGVGDIRFEKNENNSIYFYCTVYKNGGDIEESKITVTLKLYDEKGEYIGDETITTKNSLEEGDKETISLYCGRGDDITDEELSKLSVKVKNIEETDAKEANEQKEIATTISDIKLEMSSKRYNSAITMLEMAKEKYPDSKELELYEAKMKDELEKAGINMDGSKIETSEDEESETE